MTFDSALPHSALYHGGNGGASFNSSGRSSNCDDGDMQSDISLEEDVNDLNQKVRQVFLTFGVLTKVIGQTGYESFGNPKAKHYTFSYSSL